MKYIYYEVKYDEFYNSPPFLTHTHTYTHTHIYIYIYMIYIYMIYIYMIYIYGCVYEIMYGIL